MRGSEVPGAAPQQIDDMTKAAKINSIEVRGRQVGKSAEQERRVAELREQGVEVDVVAPSGKAVRVGSTVMPLWQYRKLQALGVDPGPGVEVDVYDYKPPKEGGVVAFANRAARRAAERRRRRQS